MKLFCNKSKDSIKELLDFCGSHSQIYIYGAGEYGKCCYQFLKKKNIRIEGFITTDGGDNLVGLPVYKAKDILESLSVGSGIILAMKPEYQEEIKNQFLFSCDIIGILKDSYRYMHMQNSFDVIQNHYLSPIKHRDVQWNNILIVQLEATFGDMIWSTAFCRELRRNFPNSRITMVMNRKFTELYRNCPYFDRIVPYECNTLLQSISSDMIEKVEEFAKEFFRDTTYDVVFLPRLLPLFNSDSWENVLLALSSGAKNRIAHAMKITGYQNKIYDMGSNLFTVLVAHTEARHEVLQDLDLLTACGYSYESDKMELWIDEADRAYASSILKNVPSNSILVAVAMVGSKKFKSWSPQKYGTVFERISRKRYGSRVKFLLCGGKDATEAVSELFERQKENCIDLTGRTSLTEVAAIISRSDLYLGSDTGLKHMASAFGIPVIEISSCNMEASASSGMLPTRVGPWKVDSIVLRPERGLDECQGKDRCIKPCAHCINQITEEQVENALDEMIMKRLSKL